jgi:hypothetical protein
LLGGRTKFTRERIFLQHRLAAATATHQAP